MKKIYEFKKSVQLLTTRLIWQRIAMFIKKKQQRLMMKTMIWANFIRICSRKIDYHLPANIRAQNATEPRTN